MPSNLDKKIVKRSANQTFLKFGNLILVSAEKLFTNIEQKESGRIRILLNVDQNKIGR